MIILNHKFQSLYGQVKMRVDCKNITVFILGHNGEQEAAFAQLKIWESAGTSVAFFVSSHMDLAAKQFSLLSILVVSTAALLVVVLRPERANSLKA